MMSNIASSLIFLAAISLILILIHIFSMALVGSLLGAQVEEISLGFGPNLVSYKNKKTRLSIRLILLGGFVKFHESMENLHPLKKALMGASGCIALIFIALVLLGPLEAFVRIWHGFRQCFQGPLSPQNEGVKLVSSLFLTIRERPALMSLGVAATKFAAFNLLPLSTLNGGQIILRLIEYFKPMPEKINPTLQMISTLINFLMMLGWLLAFVMFIFRQI